MSNIQSQHKKKILTAPVSLFSHHFPQASDQQIAALHALEKQYTDIEKQHKEAQNKTRQLSRMIGIARNNGENIDELMTSMQHHSKRLKALSGRLTDTGNHILGYFKSKNNPDSVEDKPVENRERVYPINETDRPRANILLEDDVADDWNRYVASNPAASIYHRAEWKTLIKKTFGHEGHYFSARNNHGEIIGILPTTRLTSYLFGDFMVSMPYFNYGGAVADHPLVEQQLMQAAVDHATGLGVSHIEYRDDIPRDGFPARTKKVNMILSLPGNHEELWETFTPKLRAQIRRPQREKTEILQGGEEYLKDFYAVFTRNMRDLGTPVYSKSLFKNILRSFPNDCRILVIRFNNQPVSAGFLIGYRDTLEIPWASTIRGVNHLSINMLLYWEVLKYAIERNYKQFDFGRSSKSSGTYRFKQQWGARPRQLYWHYWLRDGSTLPSINPNNPKYALMINLWKRLPVTISTFLGPKIIKNIP